MKLLAYNEQLGGNPEQWLRRAGYGLIEDRRSGQISFARRLYHDHYPRFHIYLNEETLKNGKQAIAINLHLDQKKPGYEGQARHNAEYDGETVENEAKRLAQFLLR